MSGDSIYIQATFGTETSLKLEKKTQNKNKNKEMLIKYSLPVKSDWRRCRLLVDSSRKAVIQFPFTLMLS